MTQKQLTTDGIIFSPEDSDLGEMKWRFDRWGYARRTVNRGRLSPAAMFAHHDVCLRAFGRRPDWSKREVCDHINRNKLDNRRENLRITSVAENNRNVIYSSRKGMAGTRGTVGVRDFTLHRCGKYQAQFGFRGRNIYVGLFSTPEEATAATVKARNAAIAEMEGGSAS
jgi:hypothetical protein